MARKSTRRPDRFLAELAASFDVIGNAPRIGRPYRQSPVAGARRILVKATRYHGYDVPRAEEVRVLAEWHAQRGVGPFARVFAHASCGGDPWRRATALPGQKYQAAKQRENRRVPGRRHRAILPPALQR